MNIIICNKNSYKYFEDYIMSIVNLIKAEVVLFDYNINLSFSINKNYIFMQNVNNNFFLENNNNSNNNFFLINTEQLSVENLKKQINGLNKNIIIIDYSIANFKYYDESFTKFLLPYQVNQNEIINESKINDICLIGTEGNIPSNRQNIINLLKEKNIFVDIVSGFGKERDDKLFKYKIILNIEYISDKYKIFESFRCDRCVYNKMIVISDMKEDIEKHHLYEYVIFVNYDKIVEKVIEILNDYETCHHKLFSNFNLKEIEDKLCDLSKPLLNKINLNCENV